MSNDNFAADQSTTTGGTTKPAGGAFNSGTNRRSTVTKTLVVARNEYINAVTSKAFIVGVALMPVFMCGAFAVQYFTRDQVDITDRKVAVVDRTGRLYDVIATQAAERNKTVFEQSESDPPKQIQPKFVIERYESDAASDERADAALSERVRQGELFAFFMIDESVFAPGENTDPPLAYHTETPSYSALPNWLERTVNNEVKRVRMQELNVDPAALAAVNQFVPMRRFGLVDADEQGNVVDAMEENRAITFGVPFGGMMLMFMMVMTVAPTMLNNVLEEKMQKIAEFLVSSVSPFQLMMGKLLGAVGVALTLSVIYLGAAYSLAVYYELDDRIPLTIYPWFMFFMLLALVIFGSIFSAIGAACSEIRDAQGLMTPVMLMVVIPMLCIGPVLDSPSSMFSRLVSLIPPATPMLMFIRIAIPPGPPVWEVILGVALALTFAVFCVWAAGRVFRIGILTQGQPATLRKLAQWVFAKE